MATEDDVRRIALALPGTTERPSYGTPGFRVADKLFLRMHDQPGVLVLWCEDEHAKRTLLARDSSAFFTTPHYDGHPSVLVRLDQVDRPALAELVLDAWRARAPLRLLKAKPGGG